MPAGSFLRSRVTADLCGWFIYTHDIDTSAVLVIPDIPYCCSVYSQGQDLF